jgi:Na+/melibiose symporter-like transporter
MAFKVKDKLFIEERHETNLKMFTGIKEVFKNKYIWILNVEGVMGAMQHGAVNLVNIIIIFSMRQEALLGVITMGISFFEFPGVFLAPFLIKKMGKRNVVLLCRFLFYSYFIFAFIALSTNQPLWIFVGLLISQMINSSGNVARGNMDPDMWDYQQYISGKRLEGSMGVLSMLARPFHVLLNMTIPLVYFAIGFTNDWNMFYVPEMMNQVFTWTLIIMFISHTLSTIPLFFWDLTEKKHAEIIKKLAERQHHLDDEKTSYDEAKREGLLASQE